MPKQIHLTMPIEDYLSQFADEISGMKSCEKGRLEASLNVTLDWLLHRGVNHFELMKVACKLQNPEPFIQCCNKIILPTAQTKNQFDAITVRSMIPRWTSTKYHTGPIDEVVRDISDRVANNDLGVYVYNSNFNPNNRRTLNDPYILLISTKYVLFIDINRRATYIQGGSS